MRALNVGMTIGMPFPQIWTRQLYQGYLQCVPFTHQRKENYILVFHSLRNKIRDPVPKCQAYTLYTKWLVTGWTWHLGTRSVEMLLCEYMTINRLSSAIHYPVFLPGTSRRQDVPRSSHINHLRIIQNVVIVKLTLCLWLLKSENLKNCTKS